MLLPVLPVALPLLAAAILAAVGRRLPPRLAHALAVLAAAVTAAASVTLALAARDHPVVYWFGAWAPRGGVCLGIAFAIDPLGAGLAALSGVLVVAALVFASALFDADRSPFDALTLVFLAALSGFGLTGDLFNLFVFFELMSVASFA